MYVLYTYIYIQITYISDFQYLDLIVSRLLANNIFAFSAPRVSARFARLPMIYLPIFNRYNVVTRLSFIKNKLLEYFGLHNYIHGTIFSG